MAYKAAKPLSHFTGEVADLTVPLYRWSDRRSGLTVGVAVILSRDEHLQSLNVLQSPRDNIPVFVSSNPAENIQNIEPSFKLDFGTFDQSESRGKGSLPIYIVLQSQIETDCSYSIYYKFYSTSRIHLIQIAITHIAITPANWPD